jgi:hypothetical protein
MKIGSLINRVLILVVAITPFATAQSPARVQQDWMAVTALPAGEHLSVKTRDGKTHKGQFGHASDVSLTLMQNSKLEDFARDKVVSVTRVVGRVAAPTLIGAAIVAGAGAGIGAATTGGCNGGFDIICGRGGGAGAGAVVGLAVGAASGFAVGMIRRKQVLIYVTP